MLNLLQRVAIVCMSPLELNEQHGVTFKKDKYAVFTDSISSRRNKIYGAALLTGFNISTV